jgi:hypothetical protein
MAKFNIRQQKRLDEIGSRRPTVKVFPNDTQAKKAKRDKLAKRFNWLGFSYFCKTYLPHIFTNDFNQDHRKIFETLLANVKGLTVITGYRGLGKTVEIAIAFVIWMICTQGLQYNIQVAADNKLSEKRTEFLHNEFKENKRISHDFPNTRPTNEAYDKFYLANNTLIEARSIESDVRGAVNPRTAKRVELIIYDDIDREKNIGNQAIGKKKKDKILGDGLGAVIQCPTGRIAVLGNEVHPNYAINQIAVEMDPKNTSKHIFKDEKVFLRFKIEDDKGRSRWPEQYPDDELPKLRRTMGYATYMREMMGFPIVEGNYFKSEWFKFWVVLPKKFRKVWMVADPSWGEKNCYKAIVVIGLAEDDKFYMIDWWADQCSNNVFYANYITRFFRYRRKYNAKGGFEITFGQKKHLKDMDDYCKNNKFPIISHLIKRIVDKENKNQRIENLDTVIEYGLLLFCKNEYTPVFMAQFGSYPNGFIDCCDATALGMKRFTTYTGKKKARVKRIKL